MDSVWKPLTKGKSKSKDFTLRQIQASQKVYNEQIEHFEQLIKLKEQRKKQMNQFVSDLDFSEDNLEFENILIDDNKGSRIDGSCDSLSISDFSDE